MSQVLENMQIIRRALNPTRSSVFSIIKMDHQKSNPESTTRPTTTKSLFLTLPRELRNTIYTTLLHPDFDAARTRIRQGVSMSNFHPSALYFDVSGEPCSQRDRVLAALLSGAALPVLSVCRQVMAEVLDEIAGWAARQEWPAPPPWFAGGVARKGSPQRLVLHACNVGGPVGRVSCRSLALLERVLCYPLFPGVGVVVVEAGRGNKPAVIDGVWQHLQRAAKSKGDASLREGGVLDSRAISVEVRIYQDEMRPLERGPMKVKHLSGYLDLPIQSKRLQRTWE